MTPALLTRMSIGRPSALSSSPSAATLASDDRSMLLRVELGVGDGGPDLGGRRLALGAVADRHDDVGAGGGQAFGHAKAQPAVGAGDDGEFSGQIGNGEGEVSHDTNANRTTV